MDAHLLFETAKHYNPALEVLKLKDIAPYQFALPAAPYVAKGKKKINLELLETAYAKIKEALCDIVLIEGAGGYNFSFRLMMMCTCMILYDFLMHERF